MKKSNKHLDIGFKTKKLLRFLVLSKQQNFEQKKDKNYKHFQKIKCKYLSLVQYLLQAIACYRQDNPGNS